MITPDPTPCRFCGHVSPTAYSARVHEQYYCQNADAVAERAPRMVDALACSYCRELITDHWDRWNDGDVVVCGLRNGLTLRTPTSAAIEDAADTPTGRDATSRHGSSGAHNAVMIMAGINPDVPSWLHLQDSLAKWRATRDKPARAGLHATKCEHAEDAGHEAECVFDTRMHGAVLVRPTGERVAA